MEKQSRRRHRRLRIDAFVRIPVQFYPNFPFVGESIDARLFNISEGGIAVVVPNSEVPSNLTKGLKLKIHFRLPELIPIECQGLISHIEKFEDNYSMVGIRFTKVPFVLTQRIQQMERDDTRCELRLKEKQPKCEADCTYHPLCQKSLRVLFTPVYSTLAMEIAFQPWK